MQMAHARRPHSLSRTGGADSAGLGELISLSDGTDTAVHARMTMRTRAWGTNRNCGHLDRRPRARRRRAVLAKLW